MLEGVPVSALTLSEDPLPTIPSPFQPFRFLDLPIELRLIVYDLFEPAPQILDLNHRQCDYYIDVNLASGHVRTKSCRAGLRWMGIIDENTILATFRLIRAEAKPVIQRTYEQLEAGLLRTQPHR